MSSSPNDSLVNSRLRNIRDRISKEGDIGLYKQKTNKRNLNSMVKLQPKKNGKSKKNKIYEKRYTLRYTCNKMQFYEKAQKNFFNIIKREKSADHLKKKSSLSSLREKIKNYFSEIGYFDTNFNRNHKNHKIGKSNGSTKNYNTLILIKKNRDDLIMEEKRKCYFSPERFDQKKKNNFYKRLLNLRTVSGAKLNNNEILLYNYKENYNTNSNNNINIYNDENNYASIIKSTFTLKNKNRNKNMINNSSAKAGKNILIKKNRYDNILYFSQNNFNNIGLIQQKIYKKNKKINPLNKSSNISSTKNKLKQNNQNTKLQNSGEDKSPSLERITVNKNEENNIKKINNFNINTISNKNNINNNNNNNENNNLYNDDNSIPIKQNNYYKINVRRIDSMTNYYTNNSININFNLNKIETEENKIQKKNEGCFTEENDISNQNQILGTDNNYSKIFKNININTINEYKSKNEEVLINDTERSFNRDGNMNNIKVCKNPDIQTKKRQKTKENKRKQILKKRSGTEEQFRESISTNNPQRERSKNKTPNKESIFTLRQFQNDILSNNLKNNLLSNTNFSINYIYNILPGNNGKLVEKVLKTRDNWDMIDPSKSQIANLIWTPLSCQINFAQHSLSEITQYVNHFEFHNELTNKANTFINLFRYCEFNDIDLFSFYPLTIILSSNQDYLFTQIEGFKRCYQDIPNLINYSEEDNLNNSNLINKYYINYFNVNLSKKIGTLQKMKIPKTHYIGKNLWVLKRTNLNRGRQMKVLSNLDEIIKEINLMFEEKKPNNLIIQKYIEAPLLYNGRKFDIRIWVLFTFIGKESNFGIYVFKEGHLKACSDIFNIDSDNLFIHLTNYSVQKHNKNFSKVEIGNEISFQSFQQELNRQNSGKNFKKDIFPEITKIIGITAKAVKNKINIMNRKNCFEIFGYDFILDINFHPFLLEINTNPGLEESSPLIKMLVPRMIDDALRLTIDKGFESMDGNDKKKNKSKFSVDGYNDEENMWLKIKTKKM